MTVNDLPTNRALVRLRNNTDFQLLLVALEEERAKAVEDLLNSRDPVHVHQLQGSARMLTDFLAAIEAAPIAVAHQQ